MLKKRPGTVTSGEIPVSIIVPAHNEEKCIEATVASLVALDYEHYEIIVVDDGSGDMTADIVISAFSLHRSGREVSGSLESLPADEIYEGSAEGVPVTLIRKRQGGKADALNLGINASQFSYFVTVDADSVLQRDALANIVRYVIRDDTTVAVGGRICPSNGQRFEDGYVKRFAFPSSWLAAVQILEYARAFLSARILLSEMNGSVILSGAFSLFRKDRVVAVGGYSKNTVGEDMELTLKLHKFCNTFRIPYRISYAVDAVCWTSVPETFAELFSQRKRWQLGLYDSLKAHRHMLFDPRFGFVGFCSYVYCVIFELLSPFIELFGLMLAAFSLFLNAHPEKMFRLAVLYFIYFTVITLVTLLMSSYLKPSLLKPQILLRFLGIILVDTFFVRFILGFVRAEAFLEYGKHRKKWTGEKSDAPVKTFSVSGSSR